MRLSIDGQYLDVPVVAAPWRVSVHKTFRSWPVENGKKRSPTEVWQLGAPPGEGLQKVHGLTGPIDDAFVSRFLFVRPTGSAAHPRVAAWVESEFARALQVWRTVYRGEVLIKDDRDVADADVRESNLVLWGDPSSNTLLARVLPQLPPTWTRDTLTFAGSTYPAAEHVPVLVYPNPLQPGRYIVLNSGPTQRPGLLLDQNGGNTSALVTPKLPDFAIVALSTPADDRAPGAFVRTGFFDESWQLPRPASPHP